MILMNTVGNASVPERSSSDLIRATIAFNNQQITGFETESINLIVKKFDLMDVAKLQAAAQDVRDPQERILVSNWSSLACFWMPPGTSATSETRTVVQSPRDAFMR